MKDALLVTLADERYVQQAKQLFSGAYWNAGWKGDYMLLSHGIPERELAWFRRKGILVRKCRPVFRESEVRRRPISVYSKFYLFTPEFRKWKNIVYLDADMIVRASLERLAEVKGFAAVRDFRGNRLRSALLHRGSLVETGRADRKAVRLMCEFRKHYDPAEPTFSSGFFTFSTDIIEEDTFRRLRDLAARYDRISARRDQAALNLFFYRKWKRLPAVYNVYLRGAWNQWRLGQGDIRGIVLHFITNEKPWMPGNHFHDEWRMNMEKAGSINLGKRVAGIEWPAGKIARYDSYLRMRSFLYLSVLLGSMECALFFARVPDRALGRLGLFLRRRNPGAYRSLKRLGGGTA